MASNLHSRPCASVRHLCPGLCVLPPAPHTPHHAPQPLHPSPSLRTPCTPHPNLSTLHLELSTLHLPSQPPGPSILTLRGAGSGQGALRDPRGHVELRVPIPAPDGQTRPMPSRCCMWDCARDAVCRPDLGSSRVVLMLLMHPSCTLRKGGRGWVCVEQAPRRVWGCVST
eukprot:251029-Rhodomonas_salina.1